MGDSVLFDPWLTDSLIDDADDRPTWIPTKTELEVYPNPFNAITRLRLTVETPGSYSVELFSITGQHVSTLWQGVVVISREIEVDARELASGVYFASAQNMESGVITATEKLVLLK